MCQIAFQKSVVHVFLTLIRNNFRLVENFETLKNSAKMTLGLEQEIHRMNLEHPVVSRIKDLKEKKTSLMACKGTREPMGRAASGQS